MRRSDKSQALRKENESLKARLAELESKNFAPDFDTHTENTKVLAVVKSVDAGTLRSLAVEYARQMPGHAIVVANPQGNFVVAGDNAVAVAKKLAEGKAGGKADLAQGTIPHFALSDVKQAIDALRKRLS